MTRGIVAPLQLLVPARHGVPGRRSGAGRSTRSTPSAGWSTTPPTAAAPLAERRRFVERWREELTLGGAPRTPVGRELAWARAALRSARGRASPAAGRPGGRRRRPGAHRRRGRRWSSIAARSPARSASCRSGSSAPRDADEFALRLARALQLVNVLRDVEEDAARDRVYVPASLLAALGIADGHGRGDRRPPPLRSGVGRAGWRRPRPPSTRPSRPWPGWTGAPLRPALVMRASYLPLLGKLKAQGWQHGRPRLRLGRVERMRLAGQAMWRSRVSGTLHVVGGGDRGPGGRADRGAVRPARWCCTRRPRRLGGRCRARSAGHDNGTHVLLGANRGGAGLPRRDRRARGWIEPEPDGLPVVDLADGATARGSALSPWRGSTASAGRLGWGRRACSTSPALALLRPGPAGRGLDPARLLARAAWSSP